MLAVGATPPMLTPSPESLEEATRLSPCNCPAKDEPGATHAHYCAIEFQYPIALALDSAKEAGRREDWRPIATAPRDGTLILLAWGEDHVSTGAYLNDDTDPHPWKFIDENNGRPIFNGARDDKYGPSHWMPQPVGHLPSHQRGRE